MVAQPIQNTIKNTVRSIIPDARVLLFGSMARGDNNTFSDYDVLVITPHTIPLEDKRSWRTKLNNALVDALHAPVDVLLNSEVEVKKKIGLPGHVIRTAVRDGVEL